MHAYDIIMSMSPLIKRWSSQKHSRQPQSTSGCKRIPGFGKAIRHDKTKMSFRSNLICNPRMISFFFFLSSSQVRFISRELVQDTTSSYQHPCDIHIPVPALWMVRDMETRTEGRWTKAGNTLQQVKLKQCKLNTTKSSLDIDSFSIVGECCHLLLVQGIYDIKVEVL